MKSAQTYQMGAHSKAFGNGILVTSLKTFDIFFILGFPADTELCSLGSTLE